MEWRIIPGFPDYEISEDGQVKRATLDKYGREWPGVMWTASGRYGHLTVGIRTPSGRKVRRRVHHLLALAFIGPPPSPAHQAAHWDGQAQHNHVSNIRWATPRENTADMKIHGTAPIGERHGRAKLCDEDVRRIRALLACGEAMAELARRFEISRSTVWRVKSGKLWRHLDSEGIYSNVNV